MGKAKGHYSCRDCSRCNTSRLGAMGANTASSMKTIGTLGVSKLTTATCGQCGHPMKDHQAAAQAYAPQQYAQPVVHIVEVPVPQQQAQGAAAGWNPDPTGRYEFRWWGGVSWMDAVSNGAEQGSDPEGVRLMDQPASAAPTQTVAEQLRDLAGLRDQGILTDEEFEAQKARLLA